MCLTKVLAIIVVVLLDPFRGLGPKKLHGDPTVGPRSICLGQRSKMEFRAKQSTHRGGPANRIVLCWSGATEEHNDPYEIRNSKMEEIEPKMAC